MAIKKNAPKKPTQTEDDQETEDQETENQETDQETDPEDENRRINAIVTSRVKREMKQVNQQLANMQKLLEGMSKKPDDDHDDDQEQEPDKKVAAVEDVKVTRKMTKLERELAEERTARLKAERERAEESEKAKRNEMRNEFQSALTEMGIKSPRLMRAALDQLEQDGYMIRDESGKIKFKGLDKYGIETMYDPKAGVKGWVEKEGKEFVPAVDAGGSGQGGSRNQSIPSGKEGYNKLTAQQKASIEIDRASQGLPPLGD